MGHQHVQQQQANGHVVHQHVQQQQQANGHLAQQQVNGYDPTTYSSQQHVPVHNFQQPGPSHNQVKYCQL